MWSWRQFLQCRVPVWWRTLQSQASLKSAWCLWTPGTWAFGLSLGESVLAYCHFHCIKDHFGDTEPCQLIDMDTVNSSGMEPESVGHLVNSYWTARAAFNSRLPSRRLVLLSQWLRQKQAGTAFEGATRPANFQYSEAILKHISNEMLGLQLWPTHPKLYIPEFHIPHPKFLSKWFPTTGPPAIPLLRLSAEASPVTLFTSLSRMSLTSS